MDNVRMGSGISGGMQGVHASVSKTSRNGNREARRERFSQALGKKKKPQGEVELEVGADARADLDAETRVASRSSGIANSAVAGHKVNLLA